MYENSVDQYQPALTGTETGWTQSRLLLQEQNSVDPDQSAPTRTVWSGFTLFVTVQQMTKEDDWRCDRRMYARVMLYKNSNITNAVNGHV